MAASQNHSLSLNDAMCMWHVELKYPTTLGGYIFPSAPDVNIFVTSVASGVEKYRSAYSTVKRSVATISMTSRTSTGNPSDTSLTLRSKVQGLRLTVEGPWWIKTVNCLLQRQLKQ